MDVDDGAFDAAHDVHEVRGEAEILEKRVVVHRDKDIDAGVGGEPGGLAMVHVPDDARRLAKVIPAVDR